MRKYAFIVFFFFLMFTLFSLLCCGSQKDQGTKDDADTLLYLNHHDTARYVGMDQCRLCHQEIYNSFFKTGMGQSFGIATRQKSASRIDKHSLVYDKYSGFYYRPFWKGDSLYMEELSVDGKDTVYRRIEKVDYIIGSGQHTNSHISSTNGYLHQMPLTFYTQKGKWDLPPGFENGFNSRFSRQIGLECMSCHNAMPGYVMGSENKYTDIPQGINCERCHGPGSIHIAQRSKGSKIDTAKYVDYSIVNPGKLPVDLQFDVCQRCHLQGNAVLKEGKSFFDFRPGMPLSNYISVFMPKYKGREEEFIMASHAERLKQSQCFVKSYKPDEHKQALRPYKTALTCVTCHNPHVGVKHTDQGFFNKACQNCHASEAQRICTESEKVRAKKQDNCVTCHMPRSGAIDIPHVTVTDHFIRKPLKKEEEEKIRQFVGLYSVNEKKPSAVTIAKAYMQQYEKFDFRPEYLDSAKKYLDDHSTDAVKHHFDLLIYWAFLKKNPAQIIKYVHVVGVENLLKIKLVHDSWDNANAWTAYRIGDAFEQLGFQEETYRFYQRAVKLAPYNYEFRNKLGGASLGLKKYDEAEEHLRWVINENPGYAPAFYNLAIIYVNAGRIKEAEAFYNKAVSLDPKYAKVKKR